MGLGCNILPSSGRAHGRRTDVSAPPKNDHSLLEGKVAASKVNVRVNDRTLMDTINHVIENICRRVMVMSRTREVGYTTKFSPRNSLRDNWSGIASVGWQNSPVPR
jgi:hypothetical protein